MKKIESKIESAKKLISKLTANNHYENSELKTFANICDAKSNQLTNELLEVEKLKLSLKRKKEEVEKNKSEFKKNIDKLSKLCSVKYKEFVKKQKKEKSKLKS